ncbi:MAG: sigma-70 family RNA polymerase sigma factor [Planctomycetota bacterium]
MTATQPPSDLPSVSTSLLYRVQQMEPDAWARLVEVFSPIVYRWARQSGMQQSEAADVVQDVFIAVARHIPNFQRQKESASFRSWLATITRNRVRDHFRRQASQPNAMGGTEALQQWNRLPHKELDSRIPSDADLERTISLADLDVSVPRQVLEMVKKESDPKTWKAFWETTVMGDSAGDVADRLQMNVASVYQAKSRVLRRLRKKLDELP